jgi:CheY-like chemotaxis protein
MNADTRPVLLVEDNPGDVELTKRALHEANVLNEVVVASNGQEAMDYLCGTGRYSGRDTRAMPVVVLLDLKMPGGIPGLEVLRRIRRNEQTELLPVIVLTSSREEEDIVSSYERGANAFIRKPIDFDKFVEAVKALGVFWILWNESPPVRRG